jgi:hypothetical protein
MVATDSDKDEGESVVTAKRPHGLRAAIDVQHEASSLAITRTNRLNFSTTNPNDHHGNAGAHLTEKRSLVSNMIM